MEGYSVLMAVYHREKAEHFRAAVESMLQQTVPPADFVLVCDGPLTPELDAVIGEFTDREPELFQILRLEKNGGLGAALNFGLQHCRRELVARMDSDDIALPERMQRQLAAMERDPQLSALGGQIAEFCRDQNQILAYRQVPRENARIREFLKYRSPMNHTTVLLRRSHILAAGNYPDVPGFEDYILWIRLISAGYRLGNIGSVCCKVRADDGMYSRRGGIRYFRNTLKMERILLDSGLIGFGSFCRNLAVRFLGTVLLPPAARRVLFLRFLRKPALETEAQGGNVPSQQEIQMPGSVSLGWTQQL